MDFKEMVGADIKTTFVNVDEFGTENIVIYDNEKYVVTMVFDKALAEERSRKAADHEAKLYQNTVCVFIPLADMKGVMPEKNHFITIDNIEYEILVSSERLGLIALELKEYDE